MLLQQEQRPVVTQRIDPKIILANTILQLNTMELLQSIENELLENPALEAVEESCDGNCVDPTLCPYCAVPEAKEDSVEAPDSGDPDTEYEYTPGRDQFVSDDEYDIVGNIESEMTLQEHLCDQLRTAVSAEDYPIGEYLINSLDERGWLGESLQTIASELDLPVEEVSRILEIVQSLDPPGVGAQTLQECLLLQLKYLREEGSVSQDRQSLLTAERLIRDQFENFWKGRYARLARAAKCSVEAAKAAHEYVRKNLNPFPASQFHPPWVYRPNNNKAVVRPDVIIRRTEFGYEIEVVSAEPYVLSINTYWRDAYNRMKTDRRAHSLSERKQISEYVERAERFIKNIHLRRQTLRQITRCIVECQAGFLETGSPQFLRALTRTRIAQMLSIHESTVSRATANKFVQLPNQEVVSYEIFFNSSLAIKDAIESIIQNEDVSSPLSDQQIVDLLKEQGIQVARRTVVKYREQQKILSSTRRRR